MRIENNTPINGSSPNAELRRRDQGGVPDGAPPPHHARIVPTEFGRTVDRVRQTAEVRPDVVESVKQRLDAGDYLTPEAAAGTVDALLAEVS